MSSVLQNILILLGLVAIAAFGYFLYTQNEAGSTDVADTALSNTVAIEANDFLRRLNELKAISLDTDIFEDPRFSSLLDLSTPAVPESIGRTNPFEDN